MATSIWKKLGVIGTGLLVLEGVNQSFDYLVYPLVIWLLGPVKGGTVMTIAALVLNYGLVLIYNKTKEDWLGFEWLAMQEEKKLDSWVGKVIRSGRWPAFLLLSWEDPFKGFVFMRGRKQVGWWFSPTDWKWFIVANLIGNLIWILMVSGAIGAVRHMFF